MKVCLNAQQDKEYLEKANELKVIWEKRDIIPEIFEQYPDKEVVLECLETKLTEEEYEELKLYNDLSRGKFKICCGNFKLFQDTDIPFYIGFPATDFYTLKGMAAVGVCAVRVDGPLIFDLASVRKSVSVEIRVTPNVAYADGYPRENGIAGGWIRPEDLDNYTDLIDVIEFEDVNKHKEQALYRIYIEEKEWDGDLKDLITNLNYPGANRMIDPKISMTRKDCKQSCMRGGICRLCKTMLDLASPELYKEKNETIQR